MSTQKLGWQVERGGAPPYSSAPAPTALRKLCPRKQQRYFNIFFLLSMDEIKEFMTYFMISVRKYVFKLGICDFIFLFTPEFLVFQNASSAQVSKTTCVGRGMFIGSKGSK